MEAVVASLSKTKIDSYLKDGIALNARWNEMALSGYWATCEGTTELRVPGRNRTHDLYNAGRML